MARLTKGRLINKNVTTTGTYPGSAPGVWGLSDNNQLTQDSAWPQYGVVPDAPTIGTATATSSTSATVSFTAPAYNGNQPISSYTAVSSPGNITGSLSQAGSGTITVNGLTKGTNYTFVVYATNAVGNSANSSASNQITTPNPVVELLVLAGGGGGGGFGGLSGGGGGGAGGLVQGTFTGDPSQNYSVTVGGGGAGNPGQGAGQSGTGSTVSGPGVSITANGGGFGGREGSGGAGGSGGGGRSPGGGGATNQPASPGTPPFIGYGNNGGGGPGGGGGGGGAGVAGGNSPGNPGGNGGNGLATWSTWASATSSGAPDGYYAGGGAGGNRPGGVVGTGGLGGGTSAPGSAPAQTGGGSGGAGYPSPVSAGSGGSGVVIFRYTTGQVTATGGTTYTSGGYTYHKFTGAGQFSIT